MGIILGETTHAHQSMEGTAALVPVYRSQLRPSKWQIAITSNVVLKHETVKGTVHGFNLIHFIFDIHLIEHSLRVEVKVTRGFPQVEVGNVGGVHNIVVLLEVLFLPEVLDFAAHGGPLGMPEDESPSGVFLDTEQIQLLSQHSVIPLLRLLHPFLIRLQLLGILPRRGVYALQHFSLFITAPVRSRHALEGNGLLGKLSGTLHMRSGTQIPPFVTNGINRDGFGFDGIEDFKLERFANLFNTLLRLLARHLRSQNGIIFRNNLVHRLLDPLQIRVGQFARGDGFASFLIGRFGKVEIIIKPIVDPRADGHLRFRECLLNRHGHDVGGGVTKFEEVNVVFVCGEFFLFLFLCGSGFFGDGRGEESRGLLRSEGVGCGETDDGR
mmetsp:Transcript_3948/g.8716  ORF Transcript_3948/g.8716 Transcript_3948/m.8716 type:complete len:383 (-) Transcript_3948:290-1438(-)